MRFFLSRQMLISNFVAFCLGMILMAMITDRTINPADSQLGFALMLIIGITMLIVISMVFARTTHKGVRGKPWRNNRNRGQQNGHNGNWRNNNRQRNGYQQQQSVW